MFNWMRFGGINVRPFTVPGQVDFDNYRFAAWYTGCILFGQVDDYYSARRHVGGLDVMWKRGKWK